MRLEDEMWGAIPADGGGDIDLADYRLDEENKPKRRQYEEEIAWM